MDSIDQLRGYTFFAGLSDVELARLAACITRRSVAKGVYLFYPDNTAVSIYLVESGLVRLFFFDSKGQEYLLNLIGPGGVVGLPLFLEDQTRLAGAAAVQTSVVLVILLEDLHHFMKHSPQFIHNIYRELNSSVRKLFRYAQELATASLNGRLAKLLLFLSRDEGSQAIRDEFELPLSQSELASWVGASRGRLNRALNKMQQLGWICISGQKILILDRPALEPMSEK